VEWDGKPISVLIGQTDAEALVGMELLKGHELTVQVSEGGKVTITRLPSGQSR
jgi:hypothetical protein